MPVKGSSLKQGPRYNTLNRTLWKRFVDTTGTQISYALFSQIINDSLDFMRERLVHNISGFKMPEYMGYAAVTQYRPSKPKRLIDWAKTREHNVKVYHTNFHSLGYMPRINWLTAELSACKFLNVYKFIPDRKFVRGVSAQMLDGKSYNTYDYEHFKSKKIKLNINKLK